MACTHTDRTRGGDNTAHNSPLIRRIAGRPMQNDELQDGRLLRNESYNRYAAVTKDEVRRTRSRFSTA